MRIALLDRRDKSYGLLIGEQLKGLVSESVIIFSITTEYIAFTLKYVTTTRL